MIPRIVQYSQPPLRRSRQSTKVATEISIKKKRTSVSLRGRSASSPSFAAEYERRLTAWSDIKKHLPFLRAHAARSQVILELGVRCGVSTVALLAGLESQMETACPQAVRDEGVTSPTQAARDEGVPPPSLHLWSVDIAKPHVPRCWLRSALWTLTIGDDLDPDVAHRQPDKIDMLFIDTSHLYEHTLAELRLYVPRVSGGGIVCCHDTRLPYLLGSERRGAPFPVARAIKTFCAESGLTWKNRTGSYGLGVIRVAHETH